MVVPAGRRGGGKKQLVVGDGRRWTVRKEKETISEMDLGRVENEVMWLVRKQKDTGSEMGFKMSKLPF